MHKTQRFVSSVRAPFVLCTALCCCVVLVQQYALCRGFDRFAAIALTAAVNR
jgi:hypothetical protein